MISIIGVGDIMPGGMLTGINTGFVDNNILQIFNNANIRVATLETAIGNTPNWYEGKMQRLGDVIYAKDIDVNKLRTLNIDIVSLANNHIFDLGPEGIEHTIDILDSMGIKHCGAGRTLKEASQPVVVNVDNKSVAFIAFCDWRDETTGWCLMATDNSAGVNPLYDKHVENLIKSTKKKYDYVVVIPHWGKEHTYWPTNHVYKMANKMIMWGADIILGGHTHRIQPVVCRRNHCIAYSMGNFLFIDRIIVPPRSTWYPDNNDSFDVHSLPTTNGYPYVTQPTLKCSPQKNRIGMILNTIIKDEVISTRSYLTIMDKYCNISLYNGKDPTIYVRVLLLSGLYPSIYQIRHFFIYTKNIFLTITLKLRKMTNHILKKN